MRIRLNGELVAEPPAEAGAFAAELDIERHGSRLDLRLTALRRSGATAQVKLLTVWRPAVIPRRERLAPLVVEHAIAAGRLTGRASGPDVPVAMDLWRAGRVQTAPVGDDGGFSAEIEEAGPGRVHLWARFRYDRPDAYIGPLVDEPPDAGAVSIDGDGAVLIGPPAGEGSRIAAKLRSMVEKGMAARRGRVGYVNGRPVRLKRVGPATRRYALSAVDWTGDWPDRIEVELFTRDGAPLGAAERWAPFGPPIRTFMAASAAGRALRASRRGKPVTLRARRVNPSGEDLVFIVEEDAGGFGAVPVSELEQVAIAHDTPFASDPGETPPPAMAAFIKELPRPGYRLAAAERAAGAVVMPAGAVKPPPERLRRVLLVRPGPNATDELYVLRPLEPLLAQAGVSFDIADPGGGASPDDALEEGTVVIVSRSCDDAWLRRLAQDRRSIFIVYLMDDDPPAAADSPGVPERYRARMIEACRSDFAAMLRLCDRFLVASPGLAARWASPKTVLLEPPFIRAPIGFDHFDDLSRVRIAYHGTDVHRDDIAFVYEPIARLLAEHGQAHFQVISTIRPPKSFAALSNHERIAPMSWPDYVLFARRNPAHIHLTPMLDTPFNRAKSIIKILDAASLGAAGLYSRVPPYEGVVQDGVDGLLVDNDPRQWEAALRRLLADPSRLRPLAEAGLATAQRVGAMEKASEVWRTLLGLSPDGAAQPADQRGMSKPVA